MPDPGSDALFLTKDMSLATYLNVMGHVHHRLERRGLRAFWVFHRDEALAHLVQEFTSGRALVEPKSFLLEAADIRGEMFNFLDGLNGVTDDEEDDDFAAAG